MPEDRPNIVLVHSHDLGRQLGCYGCDIETPNIDALASAGQRFDGFTCSAPQCSPSRGSIHTGRYPHNHGLMGLGHRGWGLFDDVPRLPGLLADAGYSTHLFGLQHVATDPTDLGFQTAKTETRALTAAENFADALPALTEDGPFFAAVGFAEPHRPFRRDDVDDAAYEYYHPENVTVPPYLPDEHGVRTEVADMRALITATVDRGVGQIDEAIAEAGVTEDTLVIYTTDHGPALPRAKGMCYSAGVDVAFIARWPGTVAPGMNDELLSNVDILPTLAELAGARIPEGVDGRSFAPLLLGEPYEARDHVFVEITWHDRYNPVRGIRTPEHTYVRNFSMLPRVYIPRDIIDQPASRPVRGPWYDQDRPAEEFYRRDGDPHELENLASDRRVARSAPADWDMPAPPAELSSAETETLLALRDELQEWMEGTDDPLLEGPVGIPGR